MNYYLNEQNSNTFAILSALADDERGPAVGPGRGGSTPPTPPPPPVTPPKKFFKPPGQAVKKTVTPEIPQLPKGSGKQDVPPPRCGAYTGLIPKGCELNPDWCNISGSPFICKPGEEKKSSDILLYGAGALVLYLLFKK